MDINTECRVFREWFQSLEFDLQPHEQLLHPFLDLQCIFLQIQFHLAHLQFVRLNLLVVGHEHNLNNVQCATLDQVPTHLEDSLQVRDQWRENRHVRKSAVSSSFLEYAILVDMSLVEDSVNEQLHQVCQQNVSWKGRDLYQNENSNIRQCLPSIFDSPIACWVVNVSCFMFYQKIQV